MPSRIYLVEINGEEKRMVDAVSRWKAIRHCVEGKVKVKVATAKDVAEFVGSGGKIESMVEKENSDVQ